MVELPWGSPDRIGRLTIPQLLCLGNEHAPGHERIRSAADFQIRAAEILQAQESWSTDVR